MIDETVTINVLSEPDAISILFCNLGYALLWTSPRSVVKLATQI